MTKLSLKQWLELIELHGSVTKAAQSQGISKQALGKKFLRLPHRNPLKLRYQELAQKSKRGIEPIYPDKKTAARLRVRRHRAKLREVKQ